MKQKTIAIIGHFGADKDITDGQTIKTRILYDELSRATDWKIRKVDTYYRKKRPVKLAFNTLWALITIKDIIVLLSDNGRRLYFPVLSFWAKHFGTRVYHDVIGGSLDNDICANAKVKDYLNSFRVNWVEAKCLEKRLENAGVTNCEVIPNFKRLNIVNDSKYETVDGGLYRFCTFSRVIKEKGIEDAVKAVESVNTAYRKNVCRLDIYGPISDAYKAEFDELMTKSSDAIKYCGTVKYTDTTTVLSSYFALLFPTYWQSEGFPGTIVDAFSAGVPVIASDWNCNAEIVSNELNGLIYPSKKVKNLEEAIQFVIENQELAYQMRVCCIETARSFLPDKYIEHIIRVISEKE